MRTLNLIVRIGQAVANAVALVFELPLACALDWWDDEEGDATP